jgi:two-component system, LytTR family, response regulator
MIVPATALIVDDEPLARHKLRELLEDVDWLTCVGEAGDGESAVRAIDAQRPDLVFLDVEMPGFSGLQVLERCQHRPAVVFTTAFDRYAVAAFELEALDYLLKPFGRERLLAALRRARQALGCGEADTAERARRAIKGEAEPLARIFVRDRGRIVPVSLADVQRLEAQDDYVEVVAGGRRHLVHLSMNDFERRLDPARFVRVHRAHIVNLDYVAAFHPLADSRLEVEMRDGTRIVASRERSKALRVRAF